MPLFSRRPRRTEEVVPPPDGFLDVPRAGTEDEPDPWLPPLTRGEALALRVMTTSALRERGHPPVAHTASAVTTPAGTTIDLRDVARAVRPLPPARWSETVDALVDRWVAPAAAAPPRLAALEGQVVAGVVPTGLLPPDAGPALSAHLQVCAMLVLDGEPRPVHDLAARGGWDTVGAAALAALQLLPVPEHHVVGLRGGADLHLLTTDDRLAPSRLLVLDRAVMDGSAARHGLLVAVPHADTLAFHVIIGGGLVAGARGLLDWAATSWAGARTPVTPHLHHRAPDGTWRPVTRTAADGNVVLDHQSLARLVHAVGG